MFDVLGSVGYLLLAAVIGGLVTYLFTRYQQSQELRARREALLKLLQNELHQIAPSLEAYNVSKAFYRDPIRLNGPTRLLDGEMLEFRKHSRLIELLLNFNVAVARHNDFVQMTNLAQAIMPVPDNAHAQWYQLVQERTTALILVRDELLKELQKRSP